MTALPLVFLWLLSDHPCPPLLQVILSKAMEPTVEEFVQEMTGSPAKGRTHKPCLHTLRLPTDPYFKPQETLRIPDKRGLSVELGPELLRFICVFASPEFSASTKIFHWIDATGTTSTFHPQHVSHVPRSPKSIKVCGTDCSPAIWRDLGKQHTAIV